MPVLGAILVRHGDLDGEPAHRPAAHTVPEPAGGRVNAHLRREQLEDQRTLDEPTEEVTRPFRNVTEVAARIPPALFGIRRLTTPRRHAARASPHASRTGSHLTIPVTHRNVIMMTQPDLYAVLGLTRDATSAEISHAYRLLLRRYHPDTRMPGSQSQNAAADAALQQVLTAYTVLRDPGRRAAYDQRYPAQPSQSSARTRSSHAFPPGEAPWRAGPVRWTPWPTR